MVKDKLRKRLTKSKQQIRELSFLMIIRALSLPMEEGRDQRKIPLQILKTKQIILQYLTILKAHQIQRSNLLTDIITMIKSRKLT